MDGASANQVSLQDRNTRRALAMAIDRQAMAQVAAGPGTMVPKGPMSSLLWINDEAIRQLPFDTAGTRDAMEQAGWQPIQTIDNKPIYGPAAFRSLFKLLPDQLRAVAI